MTDSWTTHTVKLKKYLNSDLNIIDLDHSMACSRHRTPTVLAMYSTTECLFHLTFCRLTAQNN